MSLHPKSIEPVPEETARIAHAAFPKSNVYVRLRDKLGSLYTDEAFADLFPTHGQPAEAPWRLAVITVLQFAEMLSDRQAAEAVRARLDWKYLLGLPVEDPGVDASVLCEFRARLLGGGAEQRLDTRAERRPGLEPPAVCGRDDAACPQQLGSHRTRLVATAHPVGMDRAVRPPTR
jgi:transposase